MSYNAKYNDIVYYSLYKVWMGVNVGQQHHTDTPLPGH